MRPLANPLTRDALHSLGGCAPAHLLSLDGAVAAYLGRAYAASTAWQLRKSAFFYVRFCVLFGFVPHLLAADELLFMRYCGWLARTCASGTMNDYLHGVRVLYQQLGLPHPFIDMPLLKLMRRGIRRARGAPPRKKQPITPAMLAQWATLIDPLAPHQVALFTCMLVAFFGFFHKSTVAVATASLSDPGLFLRRGDISVDPTAYCLVLQGLWASECYKGYIDVSLRQRLAATAGMMHAIARGDFGGALGDSVPSGERVKVSSLRNLRFGACRAHGQVSLPALQAPPPRLKDLLTDQAPHAKRFRHSIRAYNCAFQLASSTLTDDGGGQQGTVRRMHMHGRMYHRIGLLRPAPGVQPAFARLWIYDSSFDAACVVAPSRSGVTAARRPAAGVPMSRLMREHLRYDWQGLAAFLATAQQQLNDDQHAAYTAIMAAVDAYIAAVDARAAAQALAQVRAFFVDSPGGAGKTFLYCVLTYRNVQLCN
eukprot:scaffold27.g6007.t1